MLTSNKPDPYTRPKKMKCQNSKNENQKQLISQYRTPFSVSLSLSLTFTKIRTVRCAAVRCSVRNEETHRLRMVSSDRVLRGAYGRDPSHSSE